MFNWSIRTRLIITFLFLILVNFSILSVYILWSFNQHTVESLTDSTLSHAQVTENLLRRYLLHSDQKSELDADIKALAQKNNLRITVIDAIGNVLADSWQSPHIMENHSDRPEVISAIAGTPSTTIRYSDTIHKEMLYTAAAIRHNDELLGVVRVASTLEQVDTGFNKMKTALIATLIVTSFLAILVAVKLARVFTAPLEQITAAAREIADGNIAERVHVHTGDELEILAHTLNTLTSNLEDKVTEAQAETNKLALILRYMDNAVILMDRYGRVTTANKMARDVFSITDAMMGQHNIQVIGNSLLNQTVKDTIYKGENRVLDLKTIIHGSKRVFQVFLAPITVTENDITGVLSVFHDITTLQELHERQAEFVANASHELSTPLTAIKGFAETLLDGALADHDLSVKFITIIQAEADRMNRLVKDLLQLAKLNSHEYRQQVTLEPTPVDHLLDDVIQQVKSHADRKNQSIILEQDAPITVYANPDWLKQVFSNLLDNSIKYTPNNGKITIQCWRQQEKAVFVVQDTGIGIPAQDLPLIFDRFYRVERARTRTTGGTGLGLAIVKFIVEMHGGTIEVKSDISVGTTFRFTIPLASENTAVNH